MSFLPHSGLAGEELLEVRSPTSQESLPVRTGQWRGWNPGEAGKALVLLNSVCPVTNMKLAYSIQISNKAQGRKGWGGKKARR